MNLSRATKIHPPAESTSMKRYGSIIRLRPEKYDEYKTLHAAVWPEILVKITKHGIRNYSIYHKDGYLFSYFEYVGSDFTSDMEKMGADPKIQEWWGLCKPCHDPLDSRQAGEWWADMEELFHCD